MTTMCALLAGVPLMLGTGIGSEIRQPLGYAIVGGLLVSQALTLFTTPVVYIYMDRLGHWLGRRRASSAEAGATARQWLCPKQRSPLPTLTTQPQRLGPPSPALIRCAFFSKNCTAALCPRRTLSLAAARKMVAAAEAEAERNH